MIPFMTEDIYQNLVRTSEYRCAPESIHLCDFPAVNEQHIDKELEDNMEAVLKIVVIGRACRNTANIKTTSADRKDVCQSTDFALSEYFVGDHRR